MAEITTIFFDMGKVLVNVDEMDAVRKVARLTSHTPEEVWHRLIMTGLVSSYDRGEFTPQEFFLEIAKKLDFKKEVSYEQMEKFWTGIITGPKNDVVQIAKSLKKKYKLFLLSNIDGMHHAHIATMVPLNDLFAEPRQLEAGPADQRTRNPERHRGQNNQRNTDDQVFPDCATGSGTPLHFASFVSVP